MISAISKLPNVVSYNAKIDGGYWGIPENFEPIPGMVNAPGLSIPYTAVLDSSLDIKFLNGTYKLEEGRHINPDDSCTVLISKELADKNNLSVGDKITFQEFETGKTESTFTIVGIYSGTEGTTKQAITPDGIPANSGYIDMDGLKKFYDGVNEKLEGYDNLDIYTHSPEEAKELMETIKNLPEVKGKTFTFDVNTEDFDLVSTPLSSFGSMVDTAVLTITAIGMLVIVLFLANQIDSFIISRSGENISKLTVQIATSDMLKVFGIGVILICLAVIVASYTVIRLQPKDILTKME